MHHFIYPSQDTFITNKTDKDDLNFGLDEILSVGTEKLSTQMIYPTTTFTVQTQSVSNWCVTLFNGHISASSLTSITASTLIGSASLITGSASGSSNVSASFGSFTSFSGSATNFVGDATDLSGRISGVVTGHYTVLVPDYVDTSSIYSNRALIKFDLSSIFAASASGDIVNPRFTLKMKVARAENLPITYTLTAHRLNESWTMGNGYVWDGGSSDGASWLYRDYDNGTAWTFEGGTYNPMPSGSQTFNYEAGDVTMDVTNIVNTWFAGAENNGFIVKSSDESEISSSGMSLYFFSNDSNTIYRPVLDVAWTDANEVFVTSSLTTSSVTISTHEAGLIGYVNGSASISGSMFTGTFTGTGNIVVDVNTSASGFIVGQAYLTSETGSISFFGSILGTVTQSIVTVTQSCACPPNTTSSMLTTQSILMGTFTDGIFVGSTFTAVWDGFNLSGGTISGSWTYALLSGSTIISNGFISWPTVVSARLYSPYISGDLLGSILATNSSSYGIFSGSLHEDVTGVVSSVVLPFSGSIYLVDTLYTSSVTFTSSSLYPVQLSQPFVAIVQNLKPTVRAGNIIRVNVFGREEFPLKNFGRSTQFSQFLTPKYLPVTSYYAIKDNQTEEIVVDFDSYTQISCDLNGNYFLLDTTGLPQERYFKVLIKVEQSGSSYTIDNGDIFKIVR